MLKATSDHDLAPLRVDNHTWEQLEQLLGILLGKRAREEMLAAADQFAVAQYFRSVDNARRKLGGSQSSPTSISKLRTKLKRVLEIWGEIQNDPTAQQFIEDLSSESAPENVVTLADARA